ncbi:hypothetical protein L1987_42432 [Smallanthus sonchifolius]|uniref:Uncharacterized protein n=1 Tax=Smallanthus sonchifolius TaxID=185202 RepID=A0ACB9GIM9_9ASTR|nr:hypothetical protein L1987_42432 [Smallanthus sonchifolius]
MKALEVYETLQSYEFESKGFVDTSTTKHVGAALIAPIVDAAPVCSAPTVQSSCSKCTGCETKCQFTTNGGEGYDWSAHSEKIKQNQALMADFKGKESSENVSSVKVDNDEIALYKHHNQILVNELNKSLAINTDLKEAEKVLNERIESLTNDLAAMIEIKNVLEIQQEDLLVKLSTTKSELAKAKVHIDKYEFSFKAIKKLLHFQIHGKVKNGIGYKVVPHPFNGNITYSPEHKVDINHLANFSLSADPILSSSKPEEEIGSENEIDESISQNVGELVLREEVISDRMNDKDACQFSENEILYFLENFNKENISFHVDTKISDESKKVESKESSSPQNVKP